MKPIDGIDAQVNYEGLSYCPRCASELAEERVRGVDRLRCPACGYIFYVTPAPVTCVIAERDGRVLLVRRRYPPGAGRWCLPAGFIEPGESPEECAVRETREETGLHVIITDIFDSWATGEDPRTPVVSLAFTARVAGGTLEAGDDADDARFFDPRDLPSDIAFESHRRAIAKYIGIASGRRTRKTET